MENNRGPREEFEVTCADCGTQTTVPFKPTGDRPVKCRDCFQKDRPQRSDRNDRGARQEFEVTCADCGVQTTVPFEPRGDRPVTCRDCFQKSRGGPRGGGGGGRGGSSDGGSRREYEVTCAECGAETTVPFEPRGDRPVTCRDCFQKSRGGPRGGGGGGRGDSRGGDRPMHDATCSRCSAKTQVPFRPTPGREVLCNDCFRR